MKVIVEKREIVGTLKTLLGTFQLLEDRHVSRTEEQLFVFCVVDDEGFNNYISVHGDFIVITSVIPTRVDVKRVLVGEEA